ncbi:MAG: peptide ABC transporter substrate-binding protein, partial [Candidatus Baltobacteraceae bacterium]
MQRRCFALALTLAFAFTAPACTRVGTLAHGSNPWTHHGRLVIGSSDEPDSLNPLFSHDASADEAASLLFAPLFRYDRHGNFFPELATTVPTYANGGISRDGKTFVLHLRHGVRWADGAPLDARDLRFTWHAVMNDRNLTKSRFGWDDIRTIDFPDLYTAIVHLKEPNADVMGCFAIGGSGYPPLPEHLLAKYPDLNHIPFNSQPLSSGPWILRAWNHGSSLEFAPNPRYWRGPPKLTSLVWRVVPNTDTLFSELATHEIDVYPNVPENQRVRLSQLSGITIDKHVLANYRHLDFNTRNLILRDVRVRRAIAEAVDWERMNRVVYHGYNILAVSDIPPDSWAAPQVPRYPHDLSAAQRLLSAAGWQPGPGGIRRRAGKPLHLEISTGTNNPTNAQAEIQLQQELRAAGIDVAIKNYPVSLLFAQDGPLYGGRYDMSLTIATNGPDPDNQGLWSGAFVPPHGANTTFLNDPAVNVASEQAVRTYDRAERRRLYQREEMRLHALVPAVFLYWENAWTAYNSDLRG